MRDALSAGPSGENRSFNLWLTLFMSPNGWTPFLGGTKAASASPRLLNLACELPCGRRPFVTVGSLSPREETAANCVRRFSNSVTSASSNWTSIGTLTQLARRRLATTRRILLSGRISTSPKSE